MTTSPTIQVTATTPAQLQERLDAALSRTLSDSGVTTGVLVTRHTPTLFTVAPSDQVPYGTIQEQDVDATAPGGQSA
jgi:hypothetical protein